MNEPTKLPSLRPVMTEREKELQKALEFISGYCDMAIEADVISIIGAKHIKELADKALNFKYGGGE